MTDIARVLTTQNVAINYEVAGVGERLLARLLDLLFFAAYLFIAYYVIMGVIISPLSWEDKETYGTTISVLIPLPVMTYTLWCEPLFNGRTLGKLIIGLKVIKTDGTPAGIGDSAFRWVARIFEGEFSAFSCLSLPVAIISAKTQRIGDMIAGTIVISTKQKTTIRNTIIHPVNPYYRIVFPQVSALSDRDVNIIRDVMQQAFDTGNYQLIEFLGHKVKTVMNVFPHPQQMPTVQFLNIVLADYSHYNFEGVGRRV